MIILVNKITIKLAEKKTYLSLKSARSLVGSNEKHLSIYCRLSLTKFNQSLKPNLPLTPLIE